MDKFAETFFFGFDKMFLRFLKGISYNSKSRLQKILVCCKMNILKVKLKYDTDLQYNNQKKRNGRSFNMYGR